MKLIYYFRKLVIKMSFSTTKCCICEKPYYLGKNSNFINCKIGKYTYFGNNNSIANAEIGSFCSIASFVCIGGDSHPIDYLSTSIVFYKKNNVFRKYLGSSISNYSFSKEAKPVVIGHDVWIGEKAFIKGGICIGTGAVIGAGAVVTHDVLPYEVVAGVPARHIKFRFNQETINKLLKSEWWKLDDKSLKKIMSSRDPINLLLGEVQ